MLWGETYDACTHPLGRQWWTGHGEAGRSGYPRAITGDVLVFVRSAALRPSHAMMVAQDEASVNLTREDLKRHAWP